MNEEELTPRDKEDLAFIEDMKEARKGKELKPTGGTLLPKDINRTIKQIIEFKSH